MRAATITAVAWATLGLGCTWGAPDPQEVLARSLRPTAVGPVAEPGAKARRTLKARVWADQGHVRAVLGWQGRFRRQLEGANRVLIAALGVEIEIVSMSTWAHEGGRGALVPDIGALAARDDGTGVDLVIGLVSPLAVFSPTFEDLGRAEVLGKHMVLRGIEDAEEHVWLATALDERPAEEREALYQARLRHREVTLLLHELGHNLGALHVWAQGSIMARQISHEQGGFSPQNLALMGLALEGRTLEDPRPPEVRAALAAHLRSSAWDGWIAEEKAILLAGLGVRGAKSRAEDDAPPSSDEEPVTRASWWLARGQVEAAWDAIAPHLEALGDRGPVRALACEAAARKDPGSKAALEWCGRQAKAEPDRPRYQILYAMALQASGDLERALAAVRQAEAGIAAADEAEHPRLWTMVAQAYQRLDALTWAMAAAGNGEPEAAGRIAAYVREVRRALGAKGGALGVAPADEPAFVAAMRKLSDALRAGDEAALSRLTKGLARRFPKLGRPHVTVCRHFGERRAWSSAVLFCEAAAKRAPKAPEPHLVLGVAAFATGSPRRAVRPLERAIALAPNTKDGWSLLFAAYRATGRAKQARRLAARYEERFGQPLR